MGLDNVIDETDSSDIRIKWIYNRDWGNTSHWADPNRLDKYLDLIARQTSLSFTKERRVTTKWHVDWAR